VDPVKLDQAFRSSRQPTQDELFEYMNEDIYNTPMAYICVDALDECANSTPFLEFVGQLAPAKIPITTRKNL
jgi:hypothetical protein